MGAGRQSIEWTVSPLLQKEPSLLAPALGISDPSTIGEYMLLGFSHQHFMCVTLLKPLDEVTQ